MKSKKIEDPDETESLAKARGPNRPTVELIRQYGDLIEQGLPFDVACDYLGIAPTTFHRWLKLGKLYNQNPEVEPKHKIYGDFEAGLRKSNAAYYLSLVQKLHSKDNSKWSRELAILERRDRKNFAKFDIMGASAAAEDLDPDQRFA